MLPSAHSPQRKPSRNLLRCNKSRIKFACLERNLSSMRPFETAEMTGALILRRSFSPDHQLKFVTAHVTAKHPDCGVTARLGFRQPHLRPAHAFRHFRRTRNQQPLDGTHSRPNTAVPHFDATVPTPRRATAMRTHR